MIVHDHQLKVDITQGDWFGITECICLYIRLITAVAGSFVAAAQGIVLKSSKNYWHIAGGLATWSFPFNIKPTPNIKYYLLRSPRLEWFCMSFGSPTHQQWWKNVNSITSHWHTTQTWNAPGPTIPGALSSRNDDFDQEILKHQERSLASLFNPKQKRTLVRKLISTSTTCSNPIIRARFAIICNICTLRNLLCRQVALKMSPVWPSLGNHGGNHGWHDPHWILVTSQVILFLCATQPWYKWTADEPAQFEDKQHHYPTICCGALW